MVEAPRHGGLRWAVPEVKREQAFHLQSFVGRGPTLAAIERWLGDDAGASYRLVKAGPGGGKSALASVVAARRGGILHLLKAHRSPARMLKALAEEVRQRADASDVADADGDLDDLRASFVRALEALVEREGRALVVVDALDELEDPSLVDAFPAHLPRGVRFLLTARPDRDRLLALRSRLASMDEIELPPLDEDDVRALVARAAGRTLDAAGILERTGGLPILVRRAVALLERAPSQIGYESLPASLAELFEQVYRASVAGRARRAAILHAIAMAREPMTPIAIRDVVGPGSPHDWRDDVASMSEILLESSPGALTLWHRGMADFIRDSVLGPDGSREVEVALADHCERTPGPYALRHHVGHLTAAGRTEDALRVATGAAYRRAKIEAGLVFDLVTELESLAPAEATLMRRHAPFLARHPHALRTVLGAGEGPFLRRIAAPTAPRFRSELFTLEGHGGEVYSVATNRDGSMAASASADGTVRVWDLSNGRELCRLDVSRRRALSVAFSSDGRSLHCGTDGEGLRTFRRDPNTGAWWETGRRADGDAIWCVAVGRDGGLVATGSRAGEVKLWDEEGRCVARFVVGGVVTTLSMSSDERWVAAGSTWSRVVVFDAEAQAERWRADDLAGVPWSIELTHPRSLWAACSDGALRRIGEEGGVERAFDDDRLYALRIAPDGEALAVGGARGRVALGKAIDGSWHVAGSFSSAVNDLAYAGVARLVCACADGTLRVLDTSLEGEALAAGAEELRVTAAAFTPDGSHYVAGAHDGTVRWWRADSGALSGPWPLHRAPIQQVSFSPDGSLVLTASRDGTAAVHRFMRSGPPKLLARFEGHSAAVSCACFVPPGGTVVTGSSDQTMTLWTVFGARAAQSWGVDDGIAFVAASADGRHIAALTRSGRLWLARPGESEARCLVEDVAVVPRVVRFTEDGRCLLIEEATGALAGYSIEDRGRRLEADDPALAVEMRRRAVVSRASTRETTVIERPSGAVVAAYPHALRHVALSPDQSRMAGFSEEHVHLLALEPG